VAAVENFQASHGLAANGVIDPQTWSALLRYRPAYVTFGHAARRSSNAARIAAGGRITQAAVAATDDLEAPTRGTGTTPAPASALLPARANELRGAPGAGRP
jgi:hypothetical protein